MRSWPEGNTFGGGGVSVGGGGQLSSGWQEHRNGVLILQNFAALTLVINVIVTAAAACGGNVGDQAVDAGGGDSGLVDGAAVDASPAVAGPTAAVVFPPPVSRTDRSTLLVRGTATGGADVAAVTVTRSPLLDIAAGPMVFDAERRRMLVIDRESAVVAAVDVDDHLRYPLSGPGMGAGPALVEPVDCALDPVAQRVLVVDRVLAALLSVDVATGERVVIGDAATGTGPLWNLPRAVAWDGGRRARAGS